MPDIEPTVSGVSFVHGEHADRVFKALASRPRREILALLVAETDGNAGGCCSPEDVCACDLSERLGLGAPTVSHHMKVLLDAGLVSARKSGQWVHYRLRDDTVLVIVDSLLALAAPVRRRDAER